MKKTNNKFTKIFLIGGILISLIIFFFSHSLLIYLKNILILTSIFGSLGWAVDKIIKKQYILPVLLIVIYLIIGTIYLNNETNKINCMMCNFAPYENIITGKCVTICDICGHYPPWYLKKSEICVPKIPLS